MSKIPETIEELKYAYKVKNLPPEETTRFFIGKDYKYPKAFGIYKDDTTGNFVVYKNKADGTRAIRYEGENEAYAVKQLYQKLEEEIINQKSRQNSGRKRKERKTSNAMTLGKVIAINMVLFIIMLILVICTAGPRRGYYYYNDQYYYHQNGSWYRYYSYDWHRTIAPEELDDNYSSYYSSSAYDYDYGVSDFRYSDYYEAPTSSSSSDYGSSWDSSDSWDSDSTDWSSDW